MELPDDRVDVRVDIGVVELDVVDDQRARPVVHELGALVEERRVVLVGLDDEVLRAAEPRRDAEVARDAADQESGLQARVLENPREHARRRGLAVRSGHREHPFVAQHVLGEPLRPRRIGAAGVQQRFDDGFAARQRIADDDALDAGIDRRLVALDELDAEARELRAHRRVDVLIGARDVVAGFFRDGRDAAHERAADAEDMDAHQPTGGEKSVCRLTINST